MAAIFPLFVSMSRSYPILNIDLAALASNYHLVQQQAPKARVGAVVKANAYGLGWRRWRGVCMPEAAGIFVSSTEEGCPGPLVPAAQIFVLQGLSPVMKACARPCLNACAYFWPAWPSAI